MAAGSFAFPNRPLTVRPPGYSIWPQLGWLVGSLLLVGGCVLIVVTPIPDLREDWAIRDTARPIPQARIEDGRCKTHLVLVDCEATLVLRPTRGTEIRHTTHQYFLDFHFGDYTTTVMGDPARPTYLTTNLALEKFWNRVITLALSIPLFGALAWAMVATVLKQLRERRRILGALDGRALRPVPLVLGGRDRKTWRVAGTTGEAAAWQDWKVSGGAEPIVLDPGQGLVLGVTAGDGSVSMPLDAKLSWIGLTDAERDALRRSVESAELKA